MSVKSKYRNGRLRYYGGAVDFNLTSESTAAATLRNYGFTVVNTTHVRTLPAPASGSVVDLLFYGTTKVMTVKTTGLLFNQQTKQDVFTVTLPNAASKETGFPVTLHGDGTTGWWISAAYIPNTTDGSADIFTVTSDT